MELPNPLTLHGINDYGEQYRGYIERRGGRWEDIPPERQEAEGTQRIYFPVGAFIEEEYHVRAGYDQLTVSFPDGGFLVWFRLQALGSDEVHNRICISRDAFEIVGEDL